MSDRAGPGQVFDIAIIGGGINGCGIARDAAGRGLSVYLCDMGDLASGTSSWSSKLIHGGLRYLEHYEFRLVREALIEREVLWGIAPHIIDPLRIVLPYRAGLRPAWMLRLGLLLYDHLGGRDQLPGTRRVRLADDVAGKPLARHLTLGFEYSDCTVDDARLVVLNAIDARSKGARIETRVRAVGAQRHDGLWHLMVEDAVDGERRTITARTLVNAAGPWVEPVLRGIAGGIARARVRLVQGSHIVVRRMVDHDRAYILQNADGRIVFVIPYLDDFTLIGTTDIDFRGDPGQAHATRAEIDYLCAAVNKDFVVRISPEDVVWSFCGVRALYDDGASEAKAATRDYVLEADGGSAGQAPLLSIFGGKITTYRRLAEAALDRLAAMLEAPLRATWTGKAGWTGTVPLPGGDFERGGRAVVERRIGARFPFLSASHVRRLVRCYGTRAEVLLGAARSLADLGPEFGADLTAAEVDYLMREEWARTAEDVLWRRTKLGLYVSDREKEVLADWMAAKAAGFFRPS